MLKNRCPEFLKVSTAFLEEEYLVITILFLF
jgi:hypothetical protein